MTRLLLSGVLLTSLALPGCTDADRGLPREYRRVQVPGALLQSADARARGRALFLEHCALCHGERGDGHGQRSEGLSQPPRDFTRVAWRQSTSPQRVFFAIREGLSGTPMPEWKSLSEEDAWDMTAYVLSLGEPR
jgi:mono/diheme cytochrome c family protein